MNPWLPKLCGTIISDDSKLAVFSTNNKKPAPRRRNRKVVRGKVRWVTQVLPRPRTNQIFSVGDTVGFFQLVAIEEKKVTLEINGEQMVVSLQ